MYYTIMITEDVHGDNVKVILNKADNQFVVIFFNEETMKGAHKIFDTIDEALAVYTKFVEAIAKGEYSYEDRKSWLA